MVVASSAIAMLVQISNSMDVWMFRTLWGIWLLLEPGALALHVIASTKNDETLAEQRSISRLDI